MKEKELPLIVCLIPVFILLTFGLKLFFENLSNPHYTEKVVTGEPSRNTKFKVGDCVMFEDDARTLQNLESWQDSSSLLFMKVREIGKDAYRMEVVINGLTHDNVTARFAYDNVRVVVPCPESLK